jgi:cytochrome c-type biogenesis protein CcmH/NrfG
MLEKAGRRGEAEAMYRHALGLNPKNEDAKGGLARLQRSPG